MKTNSTSLEVYLNQLYANKNKLTSLVAHPQNGTTHTPKEIVQQPFLWRKTAALMADQAPKLKSFLTNAGLYNDQDRPNLILTGAGTSDYVGLSLVDLLRIKFKTNCNNWPTTRITANPGAFFSDDQNHVMLHFARSGNSPESIAVLEMALDHFQNVTHHIVITCNKNGKLVNLAKQHTDKVYTIVLDEATNDQGLAMTSSFSNMIIAAQALAHLDNIEQFQDLIERTATAGEYLLKNYSNLIYDLASPALTRAFYLGNNELLGAAAESALKVQELTAGQIIAKGEDTMAFRHGPISAVDSNTLVCFFLSADEFTLRYELDVLFQFRKQFHELGTKTVVVSAQAPEKTSHNGEDESSVHYITYDPDGKLNIPNLYQVNIQVLFGQLLGLFSSYRRDINVDDPTSGDHALYSRIVKGVRLYNWNKDKKKYAP
ncbi:MAG: SIS domain-containing protein [Balneolales bacterium]